MAWRIDEAVIRGELDNTVEGRTTGRIWLAGRDEPLVLTLEGDCWRDLAGTVLWFENPSPKAGGDSAALDPDQTGIVGDMTASRKAKVPTDGDAHHPESAYQWKNTLYLEWFSETNGRVVIEAAHYHVGISGHEWTMDEDAEEAQKLANLNAMRDFMAQLIQRRDTSEEDGDDDDELDEFAWEERLKESDRLTDAYQEVLEKYMEDADSERKEAFVMGWDGLLDALAERDEAIARNGSEEFSESPMANRSFDDEDDDFDDEPGFLDDPAAGDDDEETAEHPLQAAAQELAMRAMDVVERDAEPGTAAYQLVTCLLQVSGKLAGALNQNRGEYQPEKGFILAILKRCLNWLNDAVGACQQLMTVETDPDQLAALAHVRSSVFEIRHGIVELRRELK